MELYYQKNCIIFLILIFVSFIVAQSSSTDPYKVLGVRQRASTLEIRKAYKELARKWHPDKTNYPGAEFKFQQIKKAYELLSDTDRRRLYDEHGVKKIYSHGRLVPDTMEEFLDEHLDHDTRVYHKLSITTKHYEQIILENSRIKPYIIMFFNDGCFRCQQLVGPFKTLIEILEPMGIKFATVNTAHDQRLFRMTGLSSLPGLILVINADKYVYRGTTLAPKKIIDFIRSNMPYRNRALANVSNIDHFLNDWMDNRVRALILEPRNQTRLRYLLTAFEFRNRVLFGFVSMDSENCKELNERFQIQRNLDNLLLFNEYVERPVASITMYEIPKPALSSIIASNQYLMLPRLSSQEILESVCPIEWNRSRRKLCIVLITQNSKEHNFAREALRNIALQSGYSLDKVRFAYIFKEKQQDFIHAMAKGSDGENLLRIVVLWRRDTTHLKYEWVDNASLDLKINASAEQLINYTKQKIDLTIQKLFKTSVDFSYEAVVKHLSDENAQTYKQNCVLKMASMYDYLLDTIEGLNLRTGMLTTITLMFVVRFIIKYCLKSKAPPELSLIEMNAEKYNDLMQLLKPGHYIILLITDRHTTSKLIPSFLTAIKLYGKNNRLVFGYMRIEKGISWYLELLRLSMGESKSLKISLRNCAGTVIALNGHSKYFCLYHAQQPEMTSGVEILEEITYQPMQQSDDLKIQDFSIPGKSDDILDGLVDWLDCLSAGTTHRYCIDYWPSFNPE